LVPRKNLDGLDVRALCEKLDRVPREFQAEWYKALANDAEAGDAASDATIYADLDVVRKAIGRLGPATDTQQPARLNRQCIDEGNVGGFRDLKRDRAHIDILHL